MDQTRLSRLENGTTETGPTFDEVYAIEQVCKVPAGTIGRLAGYVVDARDVVSAIEGDVALTPHDRRALVATYHALTEQHDTPQRSTRRRND